MSTAVLARAGRDLMRVGAHEIAVRGRVAPVEAVLVADATTLSPVPAAITG